MLYAGYLHSPFLLATLNYHFKTKYYIQKFFFAFITVICDHVIKFKSCIQRYRWLYAQLAVYFIADMNNCLEVYDHVYHVL